MGKVIPFERLGNGIDLDESAHLFDLCRVGNTRSFILQNLKTGERRHFACVVIPEVPKSVALYSQVEGEGIATNRFYYETELAGGYLEAVEQAIKLFGVDWSLLEV
jgi:hypothetical protein